MSFQNHGWMEGVPPLGKQEGEFLTRITLQVFAVLLPTESLVPLVFKVLLGHSL